MQQRHHIFNFHIGFWGALLISGVVTIQSALLLLMTSGLTMAQTAPLALIDPPADLQIVAPDSLPLTGVITPPTSNQFIFSITDNATGSEEQIPGVSSDGGTTFTASWPVTSPGTYTIVALALTNLGQLVDTSQNPRTVTVVTSVSTSIVSPSPGAIIDTPELFAATTTSPVDFVRYDLTLQGTTSPQSLQLPPADSTNQVFNTQFDPTSFADGVYDLVPVAVLGGNDFPGTPISITIQSPVTSTFDISQPQSGDTLSGGVTITGVTNEVATEAEFQITTSTNSVLAIISAPPTDGLNWSVDFDTSTLPNTGSGAPYALSGSAKINGSIVPTNSISIFVNNQVSSNPPSISTTQLSSGVVGVLYSQGLQVTDGEAPFSWDISSNQLPVGLSLSGSTGVISGLPTVAGNSTFTVRVTDNQGAIDEQVLNLTIAEPPTGAPLAILSSNIADVTIAQPVTWTIQGTGGVPPYAWNVIAGALPSQMQLLEIAGEAVIQGTPDTPGPITFTLELKDDAGDVIQQTFEAKMLAPDSIANTDSTTGDTTNSDGTDTTAPNQADETAIKLTIVEPIPTQTISGNTVPVRIQSSDAISAPKISLVSDTGQNLLLSNNNAAAPFGDNTGKNWVFTLNTTNYPNGTYTLRADSTTNSGISASPVSITIQNGEQLEVFSGNISAPRNGQTVAGKIQLIAQVNGEIKSLMFIIETPNGKRLRAPIQGLPNAAGNFEALWDSAGDPGGTYLVKAEVFDMQNQKKGLTAVKVNLREIKPAVTESTPEQVVDPKVVTNLQQGIVPEVPVECQVENITDEAECKKFLNERRISILNEREQEVLEQEQLPEVVTRHISLDDGKATQKQEGKVIKDPLSGIIPIDKEVTEDRSVLVLGSTEPPAALKPFVQQTVPAVITFDQDGDGLPDDMEERYGTDPNNPDTDGDGFDDSTEIKNGFNPNGPGKLVEDLAPVERAILNKLPLDQPRFAGALDEELEVQEVVSDRENTEAGFKITGKAAPNSIVTLYIYSSLPIVVTTKTDAAGNWSYEMEDALVDGQHDVYVAVTNETGKIEKKSRALSFFVDSAYAVSEEDFLAASSTVTDTTSRFLLWYIIGGVLAISLGGALFFFYFKNRVVIPE